VTEETISATRTVDAPAEAVFAVLADPTQHPAIDGTGRVRTPVDAAPLTAAGQVFRVGMFHENHPDGTYEMANLVLDLEPPRVISWRPGYRSAETGELEYGGWTWRYDLTPLGLARTEVTLTYDWSGATTEARRVQSFPPFPVAHLVDSLAHLGALAERSAGY
jgi:uncharacterized protein YndB with AHSA1/START domain